MRVAQPPYDAGAIISAFQMRKPRLQKLKSVPKQTQQRFGRADIGSTCLLSQAPVPSPPHVTPAMGLRKAPEGPGWE